MKIGKHFDAPILKLSIDGDLDASSAIAMDDVIKDAFTKEQFDIFIDCKHLNYISSAGLGVFVSYLEDFSENKGGFIFFDMNDRVFNVFKILGLHDIFKIVKDESEARNWLKKS